MTDVRVIRCPACGAALTDHAGRCGYCQAMLADVPPAPEGFDVRLDGFPRARMVEVIMAIRQATGLGIKEAKDIAMSPPALVACNATRERADAICAELRRVEAELTVSPCTGRHAW